MSRRERAPRRERCAQCDRVMRDRGVSKADAPETVARASAELCMSCYQRQGKHTPPPPKPEPSAFEVEPCVLVRVDLRPHTFRIVSTHAKRLGITAGELLAHLADRATGVVR